MNYQLNFWNDLFKSLFEIHLVNGNDFDGFLYNFDGEAYIQMERLEYSSPLASSFLRYTIKSPEGGTVEYRVDYKEGGGYDIKINLVRDTDGYVRLLSEANPRAEQIMHQCYMFAVKSFAGFFFN